MSAILNFARENFPFFVQRKGNKPLLFIAKGGHWLIINDSISFYFMVPTRAYLLNVTQPYERYSKLKRGDVVFDAGASIGEQTIMYAKKVESEGLVVAIEPFLESVSYLKKNIAINGLGNVKIFEGALWSGEGVIGLRTYGLGPMRAGCQLMPAHRGPSEIVKVKACTLDKIASDFGVEKVDFLKMDIEGGEIEALKGANIPIKSMAIETHKVNGYKTTYQVCRLLKKRNFEIRLQYGSSEVDTLYAWKP